MSVWAPAAETVELCLFDPAGREDRQVLARDEAGNHTGIVTGIEPGQRYGLRTHGPWEPSKGLWHDPSLLLLDPHARAVSGRFEDHPSLHHEGPRWNTASLVPVGVAVENPPRPRPGPRTPWRDTVIYETHVRGLTMRHPRVDPELRGTYLGAASPPIIEHLLRLGVTAVELMPVAHHVTEPFLQARGSTNYWGYSTLAWFAPHAGYATSDDGRQVAEFATMVDCFHAAGLEVILDVVFNHTAEGGYEGPILSMKGLDNGGWYRLDPRDRHLYVDWTGTGNTVATHHERVRRAIRAALLWWANDLGVDGFRFDLAVTLGREHMDFDPRHLAWLTEDPELAHVKLIAEPWDLGPGGYRLGQFGTRWGEWNAVFRDSVRDVWRGRGSRRALAEGLTGSAGGIDGHPINFVTAHDGFTLADLVSYDHKHNADNGEEGEDGHDDNRSWNSGVEGPTDDPSVLELRRRRSAALLATVAVAGGVPMFLGGDELGRTQSGNNNAYALDGPTSWYDWSSTPMAEVLGAALACRRAHATLLAHPLEPDQLQWRTLEGDTLTDWDRAGPLVAAMDDGADAVVVVVNPTADDQDVVVPEGRWRVELDSSGLRSGQLIAGTLRVTAWSLLVIGPDQTI